ncbi:MAG: efflux RND transporter periplasmic adaptor subunit, partial [Planctomycetia bacterium]|nr:efflux RND transporter periplasmic adaptor subunit [Planctomycetia bacterium]
DELFTYADFEPLRVRIFLPESEVTDIEKGQRCVLRTESDGPILTEGVIERISPVIDRTSLTVEVLVVFPEAAVNLRPGAFVHIDVITRTLENRMIIPRKALALRGNRSVVFRLLDDETVQEVEVITGFENDSIVVIEEGLGIGDRLVVQGIDKLKDRSKVSVYRSIPVEVDELTVEPMSVPENPQKLRPHPKVPAVKE